MKYQLKLDQKLDKAKAALAKQEDFNLSDAFRLIDTEMTGWVTPATILGALTAMNVSASTEDLNNLVNRFSRSEQGRMRYSDFCDAFIPFDQQTATKLCRRQARINQNAI